MEKEEKARMEREEKARMEREEKEEKARIEREEKEEKARIEREEKEEKARMESVQFLYSTVATALVERNLEESVYQFSNSVSPLYRRSCSDNEKCPLRFGMTTTVQIQVAGYIVGITIGFHLVPSSECVDDIDDEDYDVEARRCHDMKTVPGARLFSGQEQAEIPTSETSCDCTWRLVVSNPTYSLHFVRTYTLLQMAVSASVAILPALRMCEECGKIAGRGEYVEETYFPRKGREEKQPCTPPSVLCHACIGSVLFQNTIDTLNSTTTTSSASASASASATLVSRSNHGDCGICQFPVRLAWRSPCGHTFHQKCVRLNNEFGVCADCPLCRHVDALEL
jgi:hypothetical protein